MFHSLFTSESVSVGHPDKIADQISDAVLDACLSQDPMAKVACETLVTAGLVVIAGEITARASVNYEQVARETIREIGYNDPQLGFDAHSCRMLVTIHKQSEDIARGVNPTTSLYQDQGAGDQGMMFGYACDQTEEFMPLPILLANRLMHAQRHLRESGELAYLRPDAKAQVTVQYDEDQEPSRIDTIVISTQHSPDANHEQIVQDMKALARRIIPAHLLDDETRYYINPTGRFVVGGPVGDCGLTGRKIMVDSYGSAARHGGGAFSGKDPSKVDRSGAYAARYVAKNVVAAGLAKRCEVQIAYAIGVPYPVSIKVETFGTCRSSEERLCEVIPTIFDLSPKGIIQMLDLRRPIYKQVAYGGHFGRPELNLPWEALDRVDALRQALNFKQPRTIPAPPHFAAT